MEADLKQPKILKSESGVSMIITFFVMVIILTVVLFISALLYSEAKIIKNMGNSVVSLYAADSGIEKILYDDRIALPTYVNSKGSTVSTVRGLCSMVASTDPTISPTCVYDQYPGDALIDHSVFCNPITGIQEMTALDSSTTNTGCNPDVCNNCEINFETNFYNGAQYTAMAQVSTDFSGNTNFQIKSKGMFDGVGRQIEISINAVKSEDAITIQDGCATPISTQAGLVTGINIFATLTATIKNDTIASPIATIYYYNSSGAKVTVATIGGVGNGQQFSIIRGNSTSGTWGYNWITGGSSPGSAYYVDLQVSDNLAAPNNHSKTVTLEPLPWCTVQTP